MNSFPASLERLVEAFARLPGVGSKSAQRMAFYVLGMDQEEARRFADAILSAKREVHRCAVCQNLTDEDVCPICSDPRRDRSVVCVVSDPKDLIAMERGREYNGLYHVLHGVISPMNRVGPDDIAVKELLAPYDTYISTDVGYSKSETLNEEMGIICFENPKMGIYFVEDPDGYWVEVIPPRK